MTRQVTLTPADPEEVDGRVTLCGWDQAIPARFNRDQRWNGWLCPWLCPTEVERALAYVNTGNSPEDAVLHEWLEDPEGRGSILRITEVRYATDPDGGVEDLFPRADGRYSLGSHSWTWEEWAD